MVNTYSGPHLHRALACLRAGYPENAVSWMWRDIGEESEGYPSYQTLKEVDGGIEYLTVDQVLENLDGNGI